MTEQRAQISRAISNRLDAVASEHPAGHQDSYAGRYNLITAGGAKLEVMFEKASTSPPHIWCLFSALGIEKNGQFRGVSRPAAELWKKRNKKGDVMYGRHAALLAMPQLKEADLVRFTPKTAGEAMTIIDTLLSALAVTPS